MLDGHACMRCQHIVSWVCAITLLRLLHAGREFSLYSAEKGLLLQYRNAHLLLQVSRAFEQLRASEWRMRPIQPLLEDMHNQSAQPA